MQIQLLRSLGWNPFFLSQLTLNELETLLPYRVDSVQRQFIHCIGLDADGEPQRLVLPSLSWREQSVTGHPTVGDWLLLDRLGQPQKLLQRKSLLQRRSAGLESQLQLIAANIDTLFIVSSCNADFNLSRIERYLTLAAEAGCEVLVVLSKQDLCADPQPYREALQHMDASVPVELITATDAADVARLKPWCGPGQTIALLGSSGVGKSTLVNSLSGQQLQPTAGIREQDSKGRHTTTARSLHCLPEGGILLDTPGMRELQLVDCEQGLQSVFADIESLAQRCQFHDCQHVSEPGCAVQAAVDAGVLEPRRLQNFHKLRLELQRNGESIAQRRAHERSRGRFYKQAKASSRRFKSRG